MLIFPTVAAALPPTAKIEAPVETSVGDPIPVIITVTTDASFDAAIREQSLAPFEVLGKKVEIELSQDGATHTFTFELTLQCFEVGSHQLDPMRVILTGKQGSLDYLETEAQTLEVRSLLANEPNAELKPATQPVVVEQDDYTILFVLGALLAVLLGVLITWLFMRWWSKRDRPTPAPPPPPPPWEIALAELQALEGTRPQEVAEGRTEPWVDAVSDSVRNYLGRRYGFQGLESTTDEVAAELNRVQSIRVDVAEVTGFLSRCDLVKFARASLADEASTDLIAEALALIEHTRPLNASVDGAVA
ncbi:MAG: hypothetical protein WBG86_22655 [Polyangiales bacterium]